MKKPWLTATLNVLPIPVGFGYLYIGRPRRFVATFFTALLAVYIGLMFMVGAAFACWDCSPSALAVFGVVVAGMAPISLLTLFTARNAYRVALTQSEAMMRRGPG